MYLDGLIFEMKTKTEIYIQNSIKYLTVAPPNYLYEREKSNLKIALDKAALDFSCGDIEDSEIAATMAARFSQFPSIRKLNMTLAECILGSFGVEEVLAVESTETLFMVSIFELYIGKQMWSEENYRHFVATRKASSSGTEDEDPNFWSDFQADIRRGALRKKGIPDRSLRLVIQGPPSVKPKVLTSLQSTIGAVIPSLENPRAIQMILTEEENRENVQERVDSMRKFSCVLLDQEGKWRVKDYEKDLLKAINEKSDDETDVSDAFLGSRGAALMGLHYLKLSCEDKQTALAKPCQWDNLRSSTLWYPDEREL